MKKMNKQFLALLLSACIIMQDSGLAVMAAELPEYTQEEAGAEQEAGGLAESEDLEKEDKAREDEAAAEEGIQPDEDKAVETDEEKSGGISVGEDESAELLNTEEEETSAQRDSAEPESGEEAADAYDAEENAEEIPEAAVEAGTEENMTSVSENILDEDIGEAISIGETEEDETERNVRYAYVEQRADAQDLSAQSSIAASKGLYFGYTEEDAENHTGTLREYISESGSITVPHKLDKTYMVAIGDGVFEGMNDKDSADTSKLPSQSASGKTLLSSGEEKILELLNEARIKEGKAPLVMNSTLRETARRKTLDMFNKNYFDHKNSDGTYTYSWLTKCGFKYDSWAENIAYNYESAEKLYNQWWDSDGHHKNMMNGSFRSIGIGVYKDSSGKIMGTQIFSNTVFQNITSVTIEFGYEKIGSRAFKGCSNLTSVTIPSTVTEIAADAFSGCSSKLTIRGKAGSYAQTYANAYGITFKAINEKSPVTKFSFVEKEIALEKDDWDFASVNITPEDYRHLVKFEKTETPEVSGDTVIELQPDGTIHALSNGTAVITASVVDDTETCIVTVGSAALVSINKISFYDDEITLYEGESLKPAYKITPVNTTDTVELTSSDSAVFAIDENEPLKINALKAGNAALTVSGKNGDGVVSASASINVRVLAKDNELKTPENIRAVTNISPKLSGVALPEGFTWKEPDVKLKADDKAPVQYFAAQYEDRDKNILQDCLVPVSVSTASGILADLDGQSLKSGQKLSTLEEYELVPYFKSKGGKIAASFMEVSCQADNAGIINIEKKADDEGNTYLLLSPKKSGKCTLTLEIKLKDEKGAYASSGKNYGSYKKKYKLQVEDAAYISNFRLETEAGQEGVEILEDNTVRVKENVTKFRLKVSALDAGGVVKATGLKFKADKSGVIKVSAVKGQESLIEVSVKKAGSAVITVTAKDTGKRSRNINVYVEKLAPEFAQKTVTLNKLKAETGAALDILEAEGNPLQELSVCEDKEAKKTSELFEVSRDDETGAYALGFKSGKTAGVKKGSYKLFLKAFTQSGEYIYPVTVKLKNTKPSVKLKQSEKLNLFYKDAKTALRIDTGAETPTEITQINVANGKPHFEAEFEQEENGAWGASLYPVNVTSGNYKNIVKTIELRLTYKDYGEDFSVTKKLSVKSFYKKASLVTESPKIMIYSKTGAYQSAFSIKEKTSGDILCVGGENNVAVRLASGAGNGVELTADEDGQNIKIKLTDKKKKSVTVKLLVSNDNWLEQAPCSVRLTVDSETPALELAKTELSLNSNEAGKEIFEIGAYVSGNRDMSIVRMREADIVGVNSAAKKLLSENKITIYPQKTAGGRGLKICLNADSVKSGTYKYEVYGWCMRGDKNIMRMEPVTLSVKVSGKKPSASVKGKGKIDIGNPQNTAISYTPKLSNVAGNIHSAALSGAYAAQFELIPAGNGVYKVKLREDSALKKGKYKLSFIFTLDNGIKVESKAFTIKL